MNPIITGSVTKPNPHPLASLPGRPGAQMRLVIWNEKLYETIQY